MGLIRSLNVSEEDFNSFKNIDKFNTICLYLINIFHRNIFIKQLTLLVYGESNTRKTTLITNIVEGFLGKENIGNVISSKNFKLQELFGKFVGILDEFRYSPEISGDLLKLLGGEGLVVEKKYSKEHVDIGNIPIIIISNNPIKDKDENINKALENRIFSVEFFNPISEEEKIQNEGINNLIESEEINIILYCNKIYFKGNKGKKKLGNKLSNKKFIKFYLDK